MRLRDWHELSLGERIILTLVICLVILFAIAIAGYLSGGWDAAAEQPLPPSKWDDRIAELDREAAANAYRDKIEKLITVWLADPSGQPARAVAGAKGARRVFINVMNSIEEQEQKIKERKP